MNLDEAMTVISETMCYTLEMRRLLKENTLEAKPPKRKKGTGFGRISHKTAADVARELHKRLSASEDEHHKIIAHAQAHKYHSPEIEKLHHNLGAIRGYKDMLKLASVAVYHPKAKSTAYQGTTHAAKMLSGEHKHLLHPEVPEHLSKMGDRFGWKGRAV